MNIWKKPAREIDAEIAAFEKACPFPEWEIERMKNRRRILRHLPKQGIGAEIGVFRGHFSELISYAAKPTKFYLVDPWTKSGETFGWGKEYTNFGKLETAAARDESILRAQRGGCPDVVVIENSFPACKAEITEKLDWVYLDASHKFEQTLRELVAVQDLLKDDAVIAGDDFAIDPKAIHHGVFQAVHEFVRQTDWCIIDCGIANQYALRRYAHPHS